jgi:D-serine deaminase-like pyridoxal phosphate-dependent protein
LSHSAPYSIYDLDRVEQLIARGRGISGLSKADLPTPALVVDIDKLESNVTQMAAYAKQAGVSLRPHAKTHKVPEIARRQVAAGAIGICCATIREAETMARAGLSGLLITSELVGMNKVARLIRLTEQRPDTMSVVDSPEHAKALSEAAATARTVLNVLIDIDPQGRRTGIEPGAKAEDLGQFVDSLPHLNLRGVHGYAGVASHVHGWAQRKNESADLMLPVISCFEAMKKAGLPMEIMSGASTGTYNIDSQLAGMTELQVGSYVFMDADYRSIGGQSGAVYDDFRPSLTVLSTVISKNHSGIATIDAGIKSFATDHNALPEVVGIDGATYSFNGDEHGRIHLENAVRDVRLGEQVELVISHCDPTVNLYERMYVCRGDQVVDVWAVAGRGNV